MDTVQKHSGYLVGWKETSSPHPKRINHFKLPRTLRRHIYGDSRLQRNKANMRKHPNHTKVLNDLSDVLSGNIRPGNRCNVAGLIAGFKGTIAFGKKGYKTQLTVVDQSVEKDKRLEVHIFWPAKSMIGVFGIGDGIVIQRAVAGHPA